MSGLSAEPAGNKKTIRGTEGSRRTESYSLSFCSGVVVVVTTSVVTSVVTVVEVVDVRPEGGGPVGRWNRLEEGSSFSTGTCFSTTTSTIRSTVLGVGGKGGLPAVALTVSVAVVWFVTVVTSVVVVVEEDGGGTDGRWNEFDCVPSPVV